MVNDFFPVLVQKKKKMYTKKQFGYLKKFEIFINLKFFLKIFKV